MQIAALNIRSEADAIAKRLSAKGYAAYVLNPAAGTPQIYRVRVGQVRVASRSGDHRGEAGERRAVQALGYALALASGVLLALSFPQFGHPAFGWIALAPLLVALAGSVSTRHAFLLGLTTGVVYFTGTLYWITLVMACLRWPADVGRRDSQRRAHRVPRALSCAVRGRDAARARRPRRPRAGRGAARVGGDRAGAHVYPDRFSVGPARVQPGRRCCRSRSWRASLASTACRRSSRRSAPRRRIVVVAKPGERLRPAVVVAGLLLVVGVWGSRRVEAAEWTRAGEPIRVGLVQGNVDQGQKWDPARAASIFTNYLDMTRQAIDRGAQFVLWPESSTPFYFEEPRDRADADRLRALARQAGVPILVGSDQIERGDPPEVLQLGVSRPRGRIDRRRVSEDAPRAVRRVRAVQADALFRGAARRSGLGLFGRRPAGAAAGRRAPDQHGDLLRNRLSAPRPPVRRWRQRAAHDDHERCVVRQDVGAVPALRAGLDARDRRTDGIWSGPRTPASAASSTRTGACSRAPPSISRPWSSARCGFCARPRSIRASGTSSRTRRSSSRSRSSCSRDGVYNDQALGSGL